jgi:hypothetical protein
VVDLNEASVEGIIRGGSLAPTSQSFVPSGILSRQQPFQIRAWYTGWCGVRTVL